MKIRFWGVRGSLPTPPTSYQLRHKLLKVLELASKEDISTQKKRELFLSKLDPWHTQLVGGNSTCVEVRANGTIIIFDMGTGIRELGEFLCKRQGLQKSELHIFIGHTHWDHIQGFPFFQPAYKTGTILNFYTPHPQLKERLEIQQDFRFFPVSFDFMPAEKKFTQLAVDSEIEINKIKIKNIELHHPGKSYGYRVEHDGKVFVFASDAEYTNLPPERIEKYINFYKHADMLFFDAQYSFAEEIQKVDWGHSSALVGIDLAVKAECKSIALTHHAPENDDYAIQKLVNTAIEYKDKNYPAANLEVITARENFEVIL